MTKYDLIVISNPELSKNATKGLLEEITSKIKNKKGRISSHQALGVKKLASPIKKNGQRFLEGIYDSIEFEQEPNEIKSFTSELRFNQSILKFQISHAKEFSWEKLNQVPDQENTEKAKENIEAAQKDNAHKANEESESEKLNQVPDQENTEKAKENIEAAQKNNAHKANEESKGG